MTIWNKFSKLVKRPEIKVFAFDVDDTLTLSKKPIDHEMNLILNKLLEKHVVAIITGGMKEQTLLQVVSKLDFESKNTNAVFLCPSSGASSYIFDTGKVGINIYEEKISKSEFLKIKEIFEGVIKESKIIEGYKISGDIIEYRSASIAVSLLGQTADLDDKKQFDPNQIKRKSILPILEKLLPEYEVKIGGATTIDITKKGIDKAYAIRSLATHLNINEDEILYVGDSIFPGGNDFAVTKTDAQILKVKNIDDTKIYLKKYLNL